MFNFLFQAQGKIPDVAFVMWSLLFFFFFTIDLGTGVEAVLIAL